MSVAWGQIIATAVVTAVGTRAVDTYRAQAKVQRVQTAAKELRDWYLATRKTFTFQKSVPGFEEADVLLAQVGDPQLRRLMVVWYTFRCSAQELLLERADEGEYMRAMARWVLTERVLDPALLRYVGGRRWPVRPWTRFEIRRLWKKAGEPLEPVSLRRLMDEIMRQITPPEEEDPPVPGSR